MSISEPENRYSKIEQKNPREILLLRGRGCGWRKCSFCDYHFDFDKDEEANFLLNQRELEKVTGCYHRLEIINSGSFLELDSRTTELIADVCRKKKIYELHVEIHWMYREQIPALRDDFARQGVGLKVKMGVETFDAHYRETVLKKGMGSASPKEIAGYADEVCLLFGIAGQTVDSMRRDIETGLTFFERVCVNIMVKNSTRICPDADVIMAFRQELYDTYIKNDRVDILMENTEFGVGDKYEGLSH